MRNEIHFLQSTTHFGTLNLQNLTKTFITLGKIICGAINSVLHVVTWFSGDIIVLHYLINSASFGNFFISQNCLRRLVVK